MGDNTNVAHSLLEAGALTGVSVVVASPPGHEPDEDVLDHAFHCQADHGGLLEVTHDPRHAVAGAHPTFVFADLAGYHEALVSAATCEAARAAAPSALTERRELTLRGVARPISAWRVP